MNKFQRVWLVSGVIFGLGIIALDITLYDEKLIISIITGSVSGIGAGLIFGFIAHLMSGREKISCVRHISTALLLTVTGLFLGIGSFYVLGSIPHGQWEQILSPPEKAIRFVGQSDVTFWGGSVFIESESGHIYSYNCDSENPCNWTKEEILPGEPEENFWSCPSGYKGSHATPLILFKKVIDSYEVNICGIDYTNQINMILLDDGSIWVWNRFSSVNEIISFVPKWLIVSSGAGFSGFIALLVRKRKHVLLSETNP